jgi:hypothetical protein
MTLPGPSAVLSAAFVVGLGLAGTFLVGPPAPRPADAPPEEFSAERAMAHIRQIAQRPHPVGSADHARVREYVAGALDELGLKAERQSTVVRRGAPTLRMARVENILARIAGTGSTGVVLLASHYDSVPAAPGAADAGSGVGAILEALRALRAGPAPRNDVVVLFTDAEELGLLGAKAFVEQHPWAADVRMAINLEARGTYGPSWMFETGAGNGAVVAEWASLVPAPAGSSLSSEIYRRLANDTDFSEFKRLKTAGLNFAFIGGVERYHTAGDAVEALDRGSVQHHGEAALRLARRFASMDLGALQARDAVYFSVPILGVVPRYAGIWAVPLAAAAALLFVAAAVRMRRRREASLAGIILAVVVVAASAGAAGYFGWRFGRLASGFHRRWFPDGPVLTSGAYAAAMVASVTAAWLALYALLRRLCAAHTLALGAGFVLLAAAGALSWFAAGASYVLLWPLVGALLAAIAASRRADVPNDLPLDAGRMALALLMGVPAALIIWPLVHSLFLAMGLAPESGAAMAVMTVLGLGALSMPIEFIVERRRWWPAAVAAVAAVSCAAVGVSETRYSDRHPKPVNVSYVFDADARTAHWAVRATRPDGWLTQFLGVTPRPGRPPALVQPWSSVSGVPGFLHAQAPVVDLPAPQATLVRAVATEGGRYVTFRARPGREGSELTVWVNGVPALDVAVDGALVGGAFAHRGAADTAWTMNYANAPAPGALVSLTLRGPQPLTVALVERSFGLPEIPGWTPAPRPASLTAIQEGDLTVVRRTYVF